MNYLKNLCLAAIFFGCLMFCPWLVAQTKNEPNSLGNDAPQVTKEETKTTSFSRPNFLWISSEDNGPQLGCYGDRYAESPNLDKLASRGMRFLNAWSNAPVCAPARTTIISGIWPTATGSQHMRSEVRLPVGFKMFPQLLREAGYFCTNRSKEDYNLTKPGKVWDQSNNRAHWRQREVNQSFFAVFNFTTTHESQIRTRPHKAQHDPAAVPLPPYHPDLPEIRQDWGQYYDKITEMDREVGEVIEQLEKDGLSDDTIIFYFGDHGSGMPRSKRWLYQSGLHVPLIVHVPKKWEAWAGANYQASGTNDQLVGFIDLAPTMLSLADLEIPEYFQGRAILGPKTNMAPKWMFAFRDRMDERYDMSRAVRNDQFLYIQNFYPHRPQGQFLEYMFQTPTTVAWQQSYLKKQATSEQSYFWQNKASDELYDLVNDPFQVNNLANVPEFQNTRVEMRSALHQWMVKTKDLGLLPESIMHERSHEKAPYRMGRDEQLFDARGLLEVADWATRPEKLLSDPAEMERLLRWMKSDDQAKQYWSAVGVLVRVQRGEPIPDTLLIEWLDSSAADEGKILAAETLARWGSAASRETAIATLFAKSDAKQVGQFVAMLALNSLTSCQPTAQERLGKEETLASSFAGLPQRYDPYLPRLLAELKESSSRPPQ